MLLINLCAEHQLFIANTFYQHRPAQIYIWYKWNDLSVASQIDFVLTRVTRRNTVNDCRFIPNAGLYTDHRPVVTTLTTKKPRKKNKLHVVQQIKLKNLQETETKAKVEVEEEMKMELQKTDRTNMTVEDM